MRKIQWFYEITVKIEVGEGELIQVLASSPVQAIDKARKIRDFQSLRQISVVRYYPHVKQVLL